MGSQVPRPERAHDEQPERAGAGIGTATELAPELGAPGSNPDPENQLENGLDLRDPVDGARTDGSSSSNDDDRSWWHRASTQLARDRSAAIAFGVLVVASFFALVFWFGRVRWFYADEWVFLAGPQATTLGDWFAPHNGHWTTLPRLVFRLLWYAVGLRAYWPYLACVVALHLAVVALLRVIMRRAGVGGWMATLVAGTFLLFGAGSENLQWAFQMAFVGALVGGLAHLVLADHDGRLDRRDALGLLCGLLGLMCSGVGPAMVVIVGTAVLVRRGWRAAAVHTVPLAVAYAAWFLLENVHTSQAGPASPSVIATWLRAFVVASFLAIGQNTAVAWLLGFLLVAGLVLAWSPLGLDEFRRRAAAPLGLMVGALLFFTSVANERWGAGISMTESSRYVYTGAALVLPALGIAAQAFVSRWRYTTPLVVVLILSGVPANIRLLEPTPTDFDSTKSTILQVTRAPATRQAPREATPLFDTFAAGYVTVGWLLDADRAGRLPEGSGLTKQVSAQLPVRLGLLQSSAPPPRDCETYDGPLNIDLRQGEVIGIKSPVGIAASDGTEKTSRLMGLHPLNGKTITVLSPDLHLRFEPAPPNRTFSICIEPLDS